MTSKELVAGLGPQSGLWPHAISGDLPIVLLCVDDIDDIAQVQQLLRAHEYWRTRRLAVDLVIINERAASYVQDLQHAIEAAVRGAPARPQVEGGRRTSPESSSSRTKAPTPSFLSHSGTVE